MTQTPSRTTTRKKTPTTVLSTLTDFGSDVDGDNDDGDKTLSSMDSDGLDFVGTEDTRTVSIGELKRKRWSVRQLGFEGRQAQASSPTLALPGLVIANGSRKRRCGDMTA